MTQLQIQIVGMIQPPTDDMHEPVMSVNVQAVWVQPDGNAQPCTDMAQVLKVLGIAEGAVLKAVQFRPPTVTLVQPLVGARPS